MNDMLKGSDCKTSSMRVVFTFTTAIVVVVWALVSLKGLSLVDIPDNVLYLIGVLATGKVGQKGLEKKT